MNLILAKEKYWDVSSSLRLERRFNPININDAKAEFFENLRVGRLINPVFLYQASSSPHLKSGLEKLTELRAIFRNSEDFICSKYVELIDFDIKRINFLESRDERGHMEAQSLTDLYGLPDKETVDDARISLQSAKCKAPDPEDLSEKEVKHIFEYELELRGFDEWKVNIEEMPAKVSVDSSRQIISIRNGTFFSEASVQRLVSHEIDVHVRRYENGKLQPDKIFAFGFPGYLETEEGLAIFSEYMLGLLKPEDLRKYRSRLIASSLCNTLGFSDLFEYLLEQHPPLEAFDITARIKRGLIDTGQYGGYTKDRVYFSGFSSVQRLNSREIYMLFSGKIGIGDIKHVNSIVGFSKAYLVPSWVNKKR